MKIIFTILVLFSIYSCVPARYHTYNLQMTHPINSDRLYYENDTFSISFDLRTKSIGLEIYNKSTDGIRINWDEVSLSLNGKAFRTVHGATGVEHIHEVQPPTTIPPKSRLSDFLIPADKIQFIKSLYFNYPVTVVTEIFPIYDFGRKEKKKLIEQLKGTKITVFMPFYIGGKYYSHYYDLFIKDIIESKKAPAKK